MSQLFRFRGAAVATDTELLETMELIARSGTKMDAMELIDDYATFLKESGVDVDDPWDMAKSNLGYMIGYLEKDNAQEIYEFFEIGHPILGEKPWTLTTEECFKRGVEWGEAIKEGRPFP